MKRCKKGNCAQKDFEYYQNNPKQYQKDKKNNCIERILNTEQFINMKQVRIKNLNNR